MRAQEEKMHLRTELNLLESNRSNLATLRTVESLGSDRPVV